MLTTGIVAALLAYGPVPSDAPVRSQALSFELASDARWPTRDGGPDAKQEQGWNLPLLAVWGASVVADLITGRALFLANNGGDFSLINVAAIGLLSVVGKPLLLGTVAALFTGNHWPGGRTALWAYLGELGAVGLVMLALSVSGSTTSPQVPIAFFATHGLLVPALAGLGLSEARAPGLTLRWTF